MDEADDKPVPNAKPTIKTSISGFWKQLFHRQKATNRQEQNPSTDEEASELQQQQPTNLIKSENGPIIPAAEALPQDKNIPVPEKTMDNQKNCIPEILEEVQMLAISDEVADPSNEGTKK